MSGGGSSKGLSISGGEGGTSAGNTGGNNTSSVGDSGASATPAGNNGDTEPTTTGNAANQPSTITPGIPTNNTPTITSGIGSGAVTYPITTPNNPVTNTIGGVGNYGISTSSTNDTPKPSPTQSISQPPIDSGNTFNTKGISDSLGGLNGVLTQSLTVQQQMLSTLMQIAGSIGPDKLNQMLNGMQANKESTPESKPTTVDPNNSTKNFPKELPVNLSRKIYA
jgi:hypothetical protein